MLAYADTHIYTCVQKGGGCDGRCRSAAERSYPVSKVKAAAALCRSSREELPHVQGKGNPSKMVGAERGHQRADRQKPQSQTIGQSEHTDHSLSNSMKLSHAIWGHPRWMGHGGEV